MMTTIRNIVIFLLSFFVICINGVTNSFQAIAQPGSRYVNIHKVAVPFNIVLTEAINKSIVHIYKSTITLISYPSQGNLMWYYQNVNGIFNQGTFDYISARVSQGDQPCTARLSSSGGFPNAYSSVIPTLYYNLSSKDKERLKRNLDTAALLDSERNGSWTIRQLINNTWYPNDINGGMRTLNPFTGAVSSGYQVGYQISNSISAISNDLSNANRYINITMRTKKAGNCDITVITSLGAKTKDTFRYSLPDSVYVDMSPIASGTNDETVEVIYGGFTMIFMTPTLWDGTTNSGWYFAYPINQAIKNGTLDITGYKFISWPPAYDMSTFSDGGTFGYISNLLICNYEKISVTNGFFDSTGKTVWSNTPNQSISVPTLQQTGYVIGGAFSFPQPAK